MKIEPVYLVLSGTLQIAAPPAEVWRHVLNYPSWQNFSSVQHISGRPREEGEVVHLIKEEKGYSFPPYYARTIKLEPQRRAIWKTYPQSRSQESDFFGIVDFRLEGAQGNTNFIYNTIYEFLVPHTDRSELDAFETEQHSNFQTLLTAIFPKLKLLAEAGAARTC